MPVRLDTSGCSPEAREILHTQFPDFKANIQWVDGSVLREALGTLEAQGKFPGKQKWIRGELLARSENPERGVMKFNDKWARDFALDWKFTCQAIRKAAGQRTKARREKGNGRGTR